MSRPKNYRSLSGYPDVQAVLDTAMRKNTWPVELHFDESSKAFHWRHRANSYRVALRYNEEIKQDLVSGTGTCRFDDLTFRLRGSTIEIHRHSESTAPLMIIDGEEVEVELDTSIIDEL